MLAALHADLVAGWQGYLPWLPVWLGLGIGTYFALSAEPPRALAPLALLLCLAGLVLTRGRGRGALLALLAVISGIALAQWRSAQVAAPVFEPRAGAVSVTGTVLRVEPRDGGALRLILGELAISGLAPGRTPERVRISLRGSDGGIVPGERIELLARLEPPPEPVAPGAFDFARQAMFERIGGVGFALSAPTRIGSLAEPGIARRIDALRLAIDARVRAAVDGRSGAMASALLTGMRGGMAEEDVAAMQDAGLAHLLAISGLHMGLVTAAAFFFVRALLAAIPPLALRLELRKAAALAAWMVALGYLLLAGATWPTQRAFVMTSIVLLALLLGRRPFSLRLVAVAALVILAATPEALLSAGFQMSFAAVTALVAVHERLAPVLPRAGAADGMARRAAIYLLGVVLTTVIAEIAIAPFAAFHFNRVTMYGLLANIVAVPAMAFLVMPLGLLALVLMPLGLEAVALVPMAKGIELVLMTAHEVANLPGAVRGLASFPVAALVLGAFGGLWLLLWRSRAVAALAFLPLAIATVLVAGHRPPDLLVSREGDLAALVEPDGIAVSSLSHAGYEREQWTRLAGFMVARRWDEARGGRAPPARCDALGCVLVLPGPGGELRVAFAETAEALVEDCQTADILIAAMPVRGACPRPRHIVDRFSVARAGAHALWIDGKDGVRIETVADRRGNRPWVRQRRAERAGDDGRR